MYVLMSTLLPSMSVTVKSCAEPFTEPALLPPKKARVTVTPEATAAVAPIALAMRALRALPKNGADAARPADAPREEDARAVTLARDGTAAIWAIISGGEQRARARFPGVCDTPAPLGSFERKSRCG